MTGPAWARVTGGVMTVAAIVLIAATLLTAAGTIVNDDPIVVVDCPDGLVAVPLRPPHPCPGAK